MKPQHYNKTQLKGHNVKSLIEENLVADQLLSFSIYLEHTQEYTTLFSLEVRLKAFKMVTS